MFGFSWKGPRKSETLIEVLEEEMCEEPEISEPIISIAKTFFEEGRWSQSGSTHAFGHGTAPLLYDAKTGVSLVRLWRSKLMYFEPKASISEEESHYLFLKWREAQKDLHEKDLLKERERLSLLYWEGSKDVQS